MFLSFHLLSKLKSRQLDFVPLSDGYILKVDDHDQIFISRGGKKKYFLSLKFVRKQIIHPESIEEWDLKDTLIEVLNMLIDLKKKTRKGSRVDLGIDEIINTINGNKDK